ncbi:hypothetical protein [Nocardia sp. NPDC019395]|uniref:WXG100-like domain-containing protein n=1 Tax=Nocardia sp. NPDC019395 TaxID=3154686 RepID=UPI0033D350D7
MAIEIPHDVALFLNFLGVPYPDINEDQVRELATHVRTFADDVAGTHQSATGAITDMGSVYQGQSYRALVASWARLSSSHMERLDELCKGVAKALEIAAEVITAVKIAVLTELALLAAAYTASMAAVVATSGASAAVGQSIALAAKKLVSAMEQMLVGYILAEVLGRAIEPLEEAVSDMIKGVVYNATADLLGVDGGSDEILIDPDEVRRYAQVLDDHADDIMKHAEKFANGVSALDFTTPVGMPGAPESLAQPASGPAGTTGQPGADGRTDTGDPAAPGKALVSAPEQAAAPRNWIPGPAGETASRDSDPSTGSTGEAAPPAVKEGTGAGAPSMDRPGAVNPGGGSPGTAGSDPADPRTAGARGESSAAGTPAVRAETVTPGAGAESGPPAVRADESPGRTPETSGAAGPVDGRDEDAGRSMGAATPVTAGEGSGATTAPAMGQGSASGDNAGMQQNPWNRPSAGPNGAGDTAPGRPSGRKSRAEESTGRPVSGRRRKSARPNPWAARPAATEPARTPWARPSRPGVPAVSGVTAEGDTAPPVGSSARDRDAVPAAEAPEREKPEGSATDRQPGENVSAVAAPARTDEGPPPRV